MDENELDIKVKCGAVLEEHDPDCPADSKVMRYRKSTEAGSSKVVVKKGQHSEGKPSLDKARSWATRNKYISLTSNGSHT